MVAQPSSSDVLTRTGLLMATVQELFQQGDFTGDAERF